MNPKRNKKPIRAAQAHSPEMQLNPKYDPWDERNNPRKAVSSPLLGSPLLKMGHFVDFSKKDSKTVMVAISLFLSVGKAM